jgi:hypothetical protein
MPTFSEIQKAFERCVNAEPTVNYVLSADASQIATVFAEMMVFREDERDLAKFKPKQKAAFDRWKY